MNLQYLESIKNKIKKFDTIIIHGHIRPDGDCYGSQFGLKNIIENSFVDKRVYVVGETNSSLSFLGKMDKIDDSIYENSLVIIVDCGNDTVISDKRFHLAKDVILIDHHISQNYVSHSWVDPTFASCSEMIFMLKEKLNMKLTFEGALAIYIGILTDSGNFSFGRVNSNTFLTVSKLLNYGIDVQFVDEKINIESYDFLKYKGYIYQNFVTEKGFVYAYITDEILKKFNLTLQQSLYPVNMLSHLENHPVWAFFLEMSDTKVIKVSIRSRGPNIYDIVKKFGGGGHWKACGVNIKSKKELSVFIKEIKKAINLFSIEKN